MSSIPVPLAKKVPKALVHHGDTRIDDFYWLRDSNDPEVMNYLKQENRYAEAVMADAAGVQKAIYDEMLSHLQEDDTEVPFPRGSFLYYRRTIKGLSYSVHCRKRGLEGAEEVLLDENELAAGKDYFSLGNFEISPSEILLAYSVDTAGDEVYVTRIQDLHTRQDLPDKIDNTYYTLAWSNDSRTFYYVTLDEAKRPYRVWRHTLGQPNDELIFEERDRRFEVDLHKSRDDQFIFIQSESKITSEVYCLAADEPLGQPALVWPRREGVLYEVESRGEDFYILTNDKAQEFRIVRVSGDLPSLDGAEEFVPARPGVTLEGIDAFERFLAIYQRENALPGILIYDIEKSDTHHITFSEPAYALGGAPNEVYKTDKLRFTYSSLVTPNSVFEYDTRDHHRTLLRQTPTPRYDPSAYLSERLFATAADGMLIPISVVYKNGWQANGEFPLLLYGYGSYGLRSDPVFRAERLPLLDRGFAFAIAHIRGGGDGGRAWYESAKLLAKRKTFSDFVDCAGELIARRCTSRNKLVVQGGSAGGMLMGAVLNLRPDLWHTVVAQVPFVDTLTTCLDPTLPLTIGEYDEWGDPSRPEFYEYIKSYSPYDNVKAGSYPHILVTTGLNDPRVSYWEPAKWVAKLRTLKSNASLLVLKTNMGAGHFGPSGRYEHLKELAFIYAFILKSLEITNDNA
jgi:oligopeptidase B